MTVIGHLHEMNPADDGRVRNIREFSNLSDPIDENSVAEVSTAASELEQRYHAAREKINADERANREFQSQLAKLQKTVDGIEDSLITAAGRKTYLEARLDLLQSQSGALWSAPDGSTPQRPQQPPLNALVEMFATVNAIKAALQVWPAVKQQLDRDLTAANVALAAYLKRAP
jgi:septal ring factor EnvC (AmiA/AmiB activator)